jgi:hypothetical protein
MPHARADPVRARRHSEPSASAVTEKLSLQEGPGKPKKFSYTEKQEDSDDSSHEGSEKGDSSKPDVDMHHRRERKFSVSTTAAGSSSDLDMDEFGTEKTESPPAATEAGSTLQTNSSIFSEQLTPKYEACKYQELHAIRTSHPSDLCRPPGKNSTRNPSATSTTIPQIDVDFAGEYAGASQKKDTDNSGLSGHTRGPLAYPKSCSAVARGSGVDLRSEMQLLEEYAEAIFSAAEDKGVQFLNALNQAVCFGAACYGDREEILALCTFSRELTQLKEWAEILSAIVDGKHFISDLTRVLDVVKVIQLSPLGSTGVPLQTRKSFVLEHDPVDPLNKVARSMDLRDLASEMERLKKLAKKINSRVKDKAVQLAASLNQAMTQNTRASYRDDLLIKFAMKIEAELKQLKDYADTLALFVENKHVISDLRRIGDLVKNVKVTLLRRY